MVTCMSVLCSLCSLLLKFLLIDLHSVDEISLEFDEDGKGHAVDMLPRFSLVIQKMATNVLDQVHQVANTAINVRCVRGGVGAENMWHLIFLIGIVLDEVPNLLVRSERGDELALLIFNDTKVDRVIRLLFLIWLAVLSHLHSESSSLLVQVLCDPLLDRFHLQGTRTVSETFDHKGILDILENLVVDSTESCCSSVPVVFLLGVLLEVVLPDPCSLLN